MNIQSSTDYRHGTTSFLVTFTDHEIDKTLSPEERKQLSSIKHGMEALMFLLERAVRRLASAQAKDDTTKTLEEARDRMEKSFALDKKHQPEAKVAYEEGMKRVVLDKPNNARARHESSLDSK